jgi:hypothetical protein
MSTVEEIEREITTLCDADVRRLRAWMEVYEADLWDAQIERDVRAGKLDFLVAEADRDLDAGLTEPL